jgi:hypothetical protein
MKDRAKKLGGSRDPRPETESELDEALEASFPASDPLAITPTSAGAPDARSAKAPHQRREPKRRG